MKIMTLAAAGFVSLAALATASAEEKGAAQEPEASAPVQLAEGLLGHFWGHEGRRHEGRHHRWRDDDDDDDDDDERGGRHARGANRPADPNAANAPVPDNGVFSGKARPKVEVQ